MKRRTIVLLIAALGLFVVVSFLGRSLGTGLRARFPSSLAAEPEGLLAFRRLLDDLRIPTVLWTRSWDDLPGAVGRGERDGPGGSEYEASRSAMPGARSGTSARGVLLIAAPLQRPVDLLEEQAIRPWLEAGGRLIVLDDATAIERQAALDRIFADAGLAGRSPLPLLDPSTLSAERPRLAAASGTPAAPAGVDLGRLMLHAEGGLGASASGVPLALREDAEVVAAAGSIGRGRVARIFGPLCANDQLLAGDNLELALRLVEAMREGGPVYFDEYHHGYGGLAPLGRGLDGRALVFAGLQGLAAAALYAAARGRRFGPPRIVPDPPRRSSLEFVRSMASLYRRATAGAHVLEAEIGRARRIALGRTAAFGDSLTPPGDGGSESDAAIARALGGGDPAAERRALDALRAARGTLAAKSCPESEVVERIVDLANLEKEALGGNVRAQ